MASTLSAQNCPPHKNYQVSGLTKNQRIFVCRTKWPSSSEMSVQIVSAQLVPVRFRLKLNINIFFQIYMAVLFLAILRSSSCLLIKDIIKRSSFCKVNPRKCCLKLNTNDIENLLLDIVILFPHQRGANVSANSFCTISSSNSVRKTPTTTLPCTFIFPQQDNFTIQKTVLL